MTRLALLILLLLTACAPIATPPQGGGSTTKTLPIAAPSIIPTLPPTTTLILTSTPLPSATPTPAATLITPPSPSPRAGKEGEGLPRPTLSADAWKTLPVIPTLSARMKAVYAAGIAKGNSPRAFSKVGDCETVTDWFLDPFDRGSRFYDLGPFTHLQPVIDQFAGSFKRVSIASQRGFTAASALSPLWADPDLCKPGETPLACEFRVQQPSFVFIMLGTNDANTRATFEANLRKVIAFSLEQGVVPILATKADNLEGDESINLTIARLADEFEAPLWNYWLAVQPLPGRGLQADGAHLTYDKNNFGDKDAMLSAWPVRNLTALQTLDSLWKGVK